MKQDEAEKLAREVRNELGRDQGENEPSFKADIVRLCDHILSGDMRREIENAAYRRAANKLASHHYQTAHEIVLALIQPPAEKDAGK